METGDKMVLAALGDGSVVGIHLGTKKEVYKGMMDERCTILTVLRQLFRTERQEAPLTALAYHTESRVLVTGDIHGKLSVYNQNDQNPCLQWQRSEHAVTDLVIKLNEDGDLVIYVANGKHLLSLKSTFSNFEC